MKLLTKFDIGQKVTVIGRKGDGIARFLHGKLIGKIAFIMIDENGLEYGFQYDDDPNSNFMVRESRIKEV